MKVEIDIFEKPKIPLLGAMILGDTADGWMVLMADGEGKAYVWEEGIEENVEYSRWFYLADLQAAQPRVEQTLGSA